MDHDRIAVSADEDNDLQEVAGTVRADEQPSVWFLSGVFGRERMIHSVEDVLVGDAMLARRLVNLHMIIVLRIGATSTRFEFRVKPEAKQRIEHAAQLVHESASDFVRAAAEQRAEDVLREHEVITRVPAEGERS